VSLWKNHKKHKGRVRETEEQKIFNLKKVSDAHLAVSNTFDHTASLAGILPHCKIKYGCRDFTLSSSRAG
jgi:hypothetical protein